MLPKIKKKLSSFINDERGTISKSNLIKGAIVLSGIATAAKNVKAIHVDPDKYYPGPHKENKLPPLEKGGEGFECTEEEEKIVGSEGVVDKVTCHANNEHSNSRGSHKNDITTVHRNTDRNFHQNIPSIKYDKGNKKLITQHSHHGQHANASSECSRTGESIHSNY